MVSIFSSSLLYVRVTSTLKIAAAPVLPVSVNPQILLHSEK